MSSIQMKKMLKLYSMIAKSKHFKLKDLADTLNCDVNNLKLTFKSQKKKADILERKRATKI